MYASEACIEQELLCCLGSPIRVSIARDPVDPALLSSGEKRRLDELKPRARVLSWLRGRAALKRLLESLGQNQDTSEVRFPNRELSLTHSGPVAIAVASRDSSWSGIGVDLEIGRGPSPKSARLFLADGELRSIASIAPEALRRLWTVKEALYKANVANARSWFTDYRVLDPLAIAGDAVLSSSAGDITFRYASIAALGGVLTAAVASRAHGAAGARAGGACTGGGISAPLEEVLDGTNHR